MEPVVVTAVGMVQLQLRLWVHRVVHGVDDLLVGTHPTVFYHLLRRRLCMYNTRALREGKLPKTAAVSPSGE